MLSYVLGPQHSGEKSLTMVLCPESSGQSACTSVNVKKIILFTEFNVTFEVS